jgi:hypothetical protein
MNSPDLREIVANTVEADKLAKMGYRRTSHKHGLIARIDREDWLNVMATALHRAPADFYVPGEPNPSGSWCDYYRRCLSLDIRHVQPGVTKLIPGSSFDPCGYIPRTTVLKGETK